MKRRDLLATSIASCLASLAARPVRGQASSLEKATRSKTWTSDSVFLQGINAPVFDELTLENLPVTGEIPLELSGAYLRNGPNPKFQPIAYNYPLEGDGMLHGIYLADGKASYRNRWIQTEGLVYETAEGRALPELRFRNYANTNIVAHAGTLMALYETGLPYQITPDLETIGEWNFQGGIHQSMTAHPRFDPQTGELHFYRYSFFTEPYLTYYVADAQGKVIRTQPIDLPQPALIHDMSISENYAIFFHCPLAFDLQQATKCGVPFVWRPEQGSRIGLVHRHQVDQAPIWIETEPFWVWHFMNAFEDNGQLKIDFAYYPQIKLESTLEALLQNHPHLQRVVIDLNDRTVQLQQLDDRTVEFPVIDRHQTGKSYQFGYTPEIDLQLIAQKQIPNYFPALVQYDQVNQTSKTHRFQPGCYGGEAVVIPKVNGTTEADTYVMTWVFDENRQASDLVILDAANFEAEPIAQIHLPVRVPMGLHGNWFDRVGWMGRGVDG